MKITIIGAGSIGLLLAAKFSIANHTVTMVCHHIQQANKINTEGIEYRGTMVRRVPVQATSELQNHKVDLLIIAVKSQQVSSVVQHIRKIYGEDIPDMLFIQNGMAHIENLKSLSHNILVGIINHGAKKLDDVTVLHTGEGTIEVSTYQGVPYPLHTLSKEDFPIYHVKDWYSMLARKLVVNCAINPLTGIFDVDNGELLTNARFYTILRELVKESSRVLNLDYEEALSNVQAVCIKTARNTSSMLTDLKRGRLTEVDAITGVILKQAELKGLDAPYSRFVYDSIKGLEKKLD
ncbi:2-dehydropantoate 2-reductase [Alkalihalobacillus macyae]|uniref:2-dehydropantoate 2-reductase n=1 Tax=Guptibacillus hwajinpoensis TaxID=208199 RepID=UPI00273A9BF5|nr:2-dehydropantoate 2-reductase [Alkalihalobacillus macyae]MDP4553106.1 2-dehydropantoate 2-reductase [Alkalihalobacillus macyae]